MLFKRIPKEEILLYAVYISHLSLNTQRYNILDIDIIMRCNSAVFIL